MPPTALRTTLERLRLHSASGVIAVSGGADSVALLHVARELGLTVTAAHFHHHLRGDSADADADFVRDLARRLGIPHLRGDGDPLSLGGNAEAAARQLRYAWLAEAAKSAGAAWVATAHTLDDQAETVLLNLLRGTGLRGLAGIAESRELAPGVRLVRPLLAVRRADPRAWLVARGESHREDETNTDPRYSRAWLRAEFLPILELRHPAAIPALARAARHASEAADAETIGLIRTLRAIELPRAGATVVLDCAAWRRLTPTDRAAIARQIWRREQWPTRELSAAALARIATMTEPTAADLPGHIRGEVTGLVVRFRPSS